MAIVHSYVSLPEGNVHRYAIVDEHVLVFVCIFSNNPSIIIISIIAY